MNLANLLMRAGRCHASRPALYQGDRLVADYAELARRAAAIAGGMKAQLGLKPVIGSPL